MKRLPKIQSVFALVVVAALLMSACASTGIGKSIQAADTQKQLIEAAAVEFVKLQLGGDPRITPAVYAQGKDAYGKWASAERSLAASLATWKTVKSAPNEQQLSVALIEVTKAANLYLDLVAKFINLPGLKAKIGG